jgi:hypothetical protein
VLRTICATSEASKGSDLAKVLAEVTGRLAAMQFEVSRSFSRCPTLTDSDESVPDARSDTAQGRQRSKFPTLFE